MLKFLLVLLVLVATSGCAYYAEVREGIVVNRLRKAKMAQATKDSLAYVKNKQREKQVSEIMSLLEVVVDSFNVRAEREMLRIWKERYADQPEGI